jgi:hypothetical protein
MTSQPARSRQGRPPPQWFIAWVLFLIGFITTIGALFLEFAKGRDTLTLAGFGVMLMLGGPAFMKGMQFLGQLPSAYEPPAPAPGPVQIEPKAEPE